MQLTVWEKYMQMWKEADVKVIPVTTAEYGISKAARPFNSRLDRKRICEEGFQPLPVWKNALERYLQEVLAERKG